MASSVPRHVAIITDGNGRWAERRGHHRGFGHIRGGKRINEIITCASQLGVGALTFYSFSTENWSRPGAEISLLWKLLDKKLKNETSFLMKHNIRFRVIGERSRLPDFLLRTIENSERQLEKNTGMKLSVALSYGARAEILEAARRLAVDASQGTVDLKNLTEEDLSQRLWTGWLEDLGDVDLVIRTSGEQRISNFLLWQSAYAEYLFLETLWPDFSAEHLKNAFAAFSNRERRFGGVPHVRTL